MAREMTDEEKMEYDRLTANMEQMRLRMDELTAGPVVYGYARVSTYGQAAHGNSLEEQKRQLRSAGAEEIFADMAKACLAALEDAGVSMQDVSSVGIGSPGTINKETGMIEFSNNLEFFNVPARELLQAKLGDVPIYLDNDANCAALGEAYAGAGHGVANFIAITLGTGVGSGIVIDGKLVTGINYAAGEMGHTVICVDGEKCNCGRRGCWESYSSATALIVQTKDAMKHAPDSLMWEIADGSAFNVNGRTAFDAMRKGDAAAKKVVENYIYYLAMGITNVVNIFQPDIICIGGGIGHEGETLLAPLRKQLCWIAE